MNQTIDKIVNLLTIKEASIIGSYADPEQKFPADIDIDSKAYNSTPETILKYFRNLFKKAYNDPNIYIIDFKAGHWKTAIPLRWAPEDIKKGYQYIDYRKVTFLEALRQKSKIKIDLIVIVDGLFTDINATYFITFKDGSTNTLDDDRDPKIDLIEDFKDLINDRKVFKAIKRLYSVAKMEDDEDTKKWLLQFLNSNLGKMWQTIALLENVSTMLNIGYSNKKVIDHNLNEVKNRLPSEYKKYIVTDDYDKIDDVIDILKCDLNNKLIKDIATK